MKRFLIISILCFFIYIPSAMASHYDLSDIDIVPEAVVTKLAQDKIDNTEELFALLMSAKGRDDFAKKYGMEKEAVDELAHKLELMQIVGIGPKAAQLLRLAGIDSLKTLTESQPEVLLDVLLRVNREHAITGVQPDLTVVRDWINRSKRIANHLE